ncbi:MAG: hypothetical protein QOJ03_2314 [Frankiaceae bacterium]|nr:hypothetical protein [Frankiaceae bacterium]
MSRALRVALGALTVLLLAEFPLLSLFTQNQSEVELSLLWPPILWTGLGVLAFYAVLAAVMRSPARACGLASLIVVSFFYYGTFFGDRSRWWLVPWLGVFVVLAFLVARSRRELTPLVAVLAVMGLVLVVPQAVRLGRYDSQHPGLSARDPRLWPTALAALPATASTTSRPDIYVIVPDDYARADVLAKYFHYDDSAFQQELRNRGFIVSAGTRSPYSDSESNIAALVNMDYLSRFPAVLGAKSEDVRPVKRVIEDNRAARLLATIGYRYVHIDTDEVTFAGGNPDISPFAPPDSFDNLWLHKSVLGSFGGPLGFNQAGMDARFRDSIRSEFAPLGNVPTGGQPNFVVFHTLLPHDPYLYGSHGQSVTFHRTTDESLSSPSGRAAYLQQLLYLNQLMLATIDRITAAHTGTPAVILIQSDEGFESADGEFGAAAALDMRVKGLTALLLPGHAGAGLPDPPNSVNDLRFVLNQVFGSNYPMLPTASYPEGDYPYQFEPMKVP